MAMNVNEREALVCETEKLYREGYTSEDIAERFNLPILLIDTWIALIKEADSKRVLFGY